jgi:hypothetical protein
MINPKRLGVEVAQSALRRGTGWSGFDFRHGQDIFLFSTASSPDLGPTVTPIQWVPGALSPGIKWPRRGTDHSVNITTLPHVFMAKSLSN